ncbi:DUF5590 domain-containing protein [Lentilactobacillus sp. Marseille-Q4993]|uniref:cell wall elongation regulator TseB-like domain-containing protein n=1 Tax=Lentilactobacillus sp. Marseille-Q4993 TaxID=3039492 RepID=UPI0024BC2640|nr:DUF5590 domain-containing protein [Lentilactobacillus sp. Marseille-Q4993]
MQRRQRIRKSNRFLKWGIAIGILLIILATAIVIGEAQSPLDKAKSESIQIAKKYADVTDVKGFYNSNLTRTYYTVAGSTSKGKSVYVIIAKKGGKVTVVPESDGLPVSKVKTLITERKKPKKINSVSITLLGGKPHWVVSYVNSSNRLCFATLNFKTGKIVQLIANV